MYTTPPNTTMRCPSCAEGTLTAGTSVQLPLAGPTVVGISATWVEKSSEEPPTATTKPPHVPRSADMNPGTVAVNGCHCHDTTSNEYSRAAPVASVPAAYMAPSSNVVWGHSVRGPKHPCPALTGHPGYGFTPAALVLGWMWSHTPWMGTAPCAAAAPTSAAAAAARAATWRATMLLG